ncbi:Agglutinin-like protein 6 [Candida viswanathii]|uniref:Agglutinin-like protein 6 n=1 Tax=Candida viswanathii TaxID=5486 RepID=A0A367XRK9_9ASCO|nr:Agglutinin-like protein 6 [Candida viswanathii]
MNLAQLLFTLVILATHAASKHISGVFRGFESLTWSNSGGYPYRAPQYPSWLALLHWNLDASVEIGDTFTLTMPCVFKFTTTQGSVDLVVSRTHYATCFLKPGEHHTSYSSLNCVVTGDLSKMIEVSGTVTIPFAFNVGGSSREADLESSTCFVPGNNEVTFYDGDTKFSTTANFQAVAPITGPLQNARIIPSLGRTNAVVIGRECPGGYTSGTIGFSSNDAGFAIDCDSVRAGLTRKLNAWNFPTDLQSFAYSRSCTKNSYSVSFRSLPANLRPFIDAYIQAPAGKSYTVHYNMRFTCSDGRNRDDSITKTWTSYQNSDPNSNGMALVVTTRTHTGSTTAVSTLPFNSNTQKTKTIQVLVPIPTTTVTTSYLGVSTSYSTITATVGGTATVIIDEPYHSTTTVTTQWTGAATTSSTAIAPSDSIDTVYVMTPTPNPTVTTTEFGDVAELTTRTATHGGTDTVVVIAPHNPTATTTVFADVAQFTTTTVTLAPGNTDTEIVYAPANPTTTTTEFGDVSELTITTVTLAPGHTDTIIIYRPPNPTVTTTRYGSVSDPTTYTYKNLPGETDLVIVLEPFDRPTETSFGLDIVLSSDTATPISSAYYVSQSESVEHESFIQFPSNSVSYESTRETSSAELAVSGTVLPSEVAESSRLEPSVAEFTELSSSLSVASLSSELESSFTFESVHSGEASIDPFVESSSSFSMESSANFIESSYSVYSEFASTSFDESVAAPSIKSSSLIESSSGSFVESSIATSAEISNASSTPSSTSVIEESSPVYTDSSTSPEVSPLDSSSLEAAELSSVGFSEPYKATVDVRTSVAAASVSVTTNSELVESSSTEPYSSSSDHVIDNPSSERYASVTGISHEDFSSSLQLSLSLLSVTIEPSWEPPFVNTTTMESSSVQTSELPSSTDTPRKSSKSDQATETEISETSIPISQITSRSDSVESVSELTPIPNPQVSSTSTANTETEPYETTIPTSPVISKSDGESLSHATTVPSPQITSISDDSSQSEIHMTTTSTSQTTSTFSMTSSVISVYFGSGSLPDIPHILASLMAILLVLY